MKKRLLGGLTADRFLRRHWQKEPLLVRGAVPGFAGWLTRAALEKLARRDDAEARLVIRCGDAWEVRHGPLRARDLRIPDGARWTLLVQGVDQHVPAAAELLRRFAFVPHARLDDVMVSFAPAGGGVGPHFDSYDVFLLQGPGQRRWRISRQRDLALVDGAPLKLLERFVPEEEWVLNPSDMLYLPPHCAHDGVAVTDCLTYSIGFRAPGRQELAAEFLAFLEDRFELPGHYQDPDLRPSRHPGRLPPALVRAAADAVAQIRWDADDVAEFLGRYLTEPKPQVVFAPPRAPLSLARFLERAARRPLRLDPRTRMLYDGERVFVNGETVAVGSGRRLLMRLADDRVLSGRRLPPDTGELLYQWHRSGWMNFD